MKYAFFLGCTIPARSRHYELSARQVAEKLGIVLTDVDGFMCCGFPIKNADKHSSLLMSAYNLALAQQKGLDVCTLCSSCTSALTEAAHELEKDQRTRQMINERLAKVGLQYQGHSKVKHLARVLHQEVGEEKIKKHITKKLEGLRIASHYGCHYLKPSEIYENFDQVEFPHTLDELVAWTGATVVDYVNKKRCCGGPLLAVDEKTALGMAKQKLDDLQDAKVQAVNLVCPFCSVMYDGNQKGVETQFNRTYNIPVLFLTQILGMAMGLDRKEVGLNMNVVKTKEALAAFFPKEE